MTFDDKCDECLIFFNFCESEPAMTLVTVNNY